MRASARVKITAPAKASQAFCEARVTPAVHVWLKLVGTLHGRSLHVQERHWNGNGHQHGLAAAWQQAAGTWPVTETSKLSQLCAAGKGPQQPCLHGL